MKSWDHSFESGFPGAKADQYLLENLRFYDEKYVKTFRICSDRKTNKSEKYDCNLII